MNSQISADTLITNKVKKISPKQRKWLKVYTETLNATEAAMQAYDCKKREYAAQIGYENLRKLDFVGLMDASGLTEDYLVKGIKDGTNSTRPIVVNGKVSGVADYTTRHKYYETAFKLRGKLSDAGKLEISGPNGGPIQTEILAGIGFLNKPEKG